MSKNKVKATASAPPRQQPKRFAKSVSAVLSGSFLTRDYVQRNMPFILFLVGLMIVYIAYGYSAEKAVKKIVHEQVELKDLKAQSLTAHSKLEQIKQQSRIAESIKELGLKESTTPPNIITIPKEEE